METCINLLYLAEFFLEREIFRKKNQKTHLGFSKFFLPKSLQFMRKFDKL
jgi:hypothetical protein